MLLDKLDKRARQGVLCGGGRELEFPISKGPIYRQVRGERNLESMDRLVDTAIPPR